MSEYVTDTHALVWHLTQSKKLSQTAWTIFEGADAAAEAVGDEIEHGCEIAGKVWKLML